MDPCWYVYTGNIGPRTRMMYVCIWP